MPLYEVKCVGCGNVEEVLLIKQEEIKDFLSRQTYEYRCSKCGNILQRTMSVPGKGKVK